MLSLVSELVMHHDLIEVNGPFPELTPEKYLAHAHACERTEWLCLAIFIHGLGLSWSLVGWQFLHWFWWICSSWACFGDVIIGLHCQSLSCIMIWLRSRVLFLSWHLKSTWIMHMLVWGQSDVGWHFLHWFWWVCWVKLSLLWWCHHWPALSWSLPEMLAICLVQNECSSSVISHIYPWKFHRHMVPGHSRQSPDLRAPTKTYLTYGFSFESNMSRTPSLTLPNDNCIAQNCLCGSWPLFCVTLDQDRDKYHRLVRMCMCLLWLVVACLPWSRQRQVALLFWRWFPWSRQMQVAFLFWRWLF